MAARARSEAGSWAWTMLAATANTTTVATSTACILCDSKKQLLCQTQRKLLNRHPQLARDALGVHEAQLVEVMTQ